MKHGHVPKSGVVQKVLAVAEENAGQGVPAVPEDAALNHMS